VIFPKGVIAAENSAIIVRNIDGNDWVAEF